MPKLTWSYALVILFLHIFNVTAKVQVVTLTMGETGEGDRSDWKFLNKFGFGLGTSTYRLRARELQKRSAAGARLVLEPYVDEQWPEAEMVEEPCQRVQHSRKTRQLRVGHQGQWGEWMEGTIKHNVRSHVWYFALSACGTDTLMNGTRTFEVEFETRQADGSHFSIESKFAPYSSLLCLLGCTGFLGSFFRRSRDFLDKTGSLHPVIYTLAGVVVAQYLAQLFHICHLGLFLSDGRGWHAIEVLVEILLTGSQVVQTSLLIVIAMGYTLTRSKLGDLNVFLPVSGVVALIHIALVVLDKMQDEASHRFTDHEGFKGWAFLTLRLALYAWFCFAARNTADAGGFKLRAFMSKFQVAASLYFLAYPTMFFVNSIFAPYYRKPVLEFGLMAAQVCSNVWLSSLFLGRGAYFEASTLSASPLPGGNRAPPRFFKDD